MKIPKIIFLSYKDVIQIEKFPKNHLFFKRINFSNLFFTANFFSILFCTIKIEFPPICFFSLSNNKKKQETLKNSIYSFKHFLFKLVFFILRGTKINMKKSMPEKTEVGNLHMLFLYKKVGFNGCFLKNV